MPAAKQVSKPTETTSGGRTIVQLAQEDVALLDKVIEHVAKQIETAAGVAVTLTRTQVVRSLIHTKHSEIEAVAATLAEVAPSDKVEDTPASS